MTRFTLPVPGDPGRRIAVRVEGPANGAQECPYVVIVHGFKGFMDWGFFPELSRRLARSGLVAVSYNCSGSGVGEGRDFSEDEREIQAFAKNTFSKELEDLELVHAHVRSGALPDVDARRGALFGHSRGGGVVLLHAAGREDLRALVTWAAIDDVDRFDEGTKALWRAQGSLMIPNARLGRPHRLELDALEDVEQNRERLDVLRACASIRAPALIAHGQADETVAPEAAERILAALPPGLGQSLSIEGAGHTFGARHPLETNPPALACVLTATEAFLVERLREE